jgi:hypothetical protein
MARFFGGLNKEISGFVEMFSYHTLQDLVDQAMHTERKIQQETRGKSYASHSIVASWHKQQSGTSFGGGRSQGAAARPSPPIATSKMVVSTESYLANQQRPAASATAPTVASAATSSTHSREIVCHKCHGHGHVAAQCPSRRTMIVNEHSEWESKSDPEEDGPIYDEELENDENAIQPDEGDNNCFISL